MNIEFKLLPPMMPNFINYQAPAGLKLEGFSAEGNKIPVKSLTKAQAEQYADEMKQEFISHWENLQSK